MMRFGMMLLATCFNAGWVVPFYLCVSSVIGWCQVEASPVIYGTPRQVNSFPFLEFAQTTLIVACVWLTAVIVLNTLFHGRLFQTSAGGQQ